MKKIISMAAVASVAMMLASCCGCGKGKSQSHTLVSDSWKLVELADGQKLEASNDDSYTITFDAANGRVFGVGDCNRYFGGYEEMDANRLKFSAMGATRMMCPNQEGEDKFMKALSDVDSYTLDGDNLMLQKDGEVVAIFEAVPLVKAE